MTEAVKPPRKKFNTASGKAKGRTGQQEVRDALLATFPELEPDDVRSTSMGASGVDLQLSPAAKKLLPISVEVKRRKTFDTLYGFLDQANRKDGLAPTVFMRGDRKPWLVMLGLDNYLKLLSDSATLKKMNRG